MFRTAANPIDILGTRTRFHSKEGIFSENKTIFFFLDYIQFHFLETKIFSRFLWILLSALESSGRYIKPVNISGEYCSLIAKQK